MLFSERKKMQDARSEGGWCLGSWASLELGLCLANVLTVRASAARTRGLEASLRPVSLKSWLGHDVARGLSPVVLGKTAPWTLLLRCRREEPSRAADMTRCQGSASLCRQAPGTRNSDWLFAGGVQSLEGEGWPERAPH